MADDNRESRGQDADPRSDLEQAVQSRSDEADAAGGGGATSIANRPGDEDGVSGSRAEAKNQDVAQQ
jgi:hypothetical protein